MPSLTPKPTHAIQESRPRLDAVQNSETISNDSGIVGVRRHPHPLEERLDADHLTNVVKLKEYFGHQASIELPLQEAFHGIGMDVAPDIGRVVEDGEAARLLRQPIREFDVLIAVEGKFEIEAVALSVIDNISIK